MKNPKTILAHLFENPSKFYEQRCFNRLKSLLPKTLQEAILYIYRRNDVLYFVLKHPGYVMEVNYNKNLIKELLTLLKSKELYCNEIEISRIKAYAKFVPKKEVATKPMQRYEERASGNFESSKEFAHIFEKIKKAIKANGKT
jgi:hypothetical protein